MCVITLDVFGRASEQNFKEKLARACQTPELQSCKLYEVFGATIQFFGVPLESELGLHLVPN
jgi:hypothetical protein